MSDGCNTSETCLKAPYELSRESFSEKYCFSAEIWSEQGEMTYTPLCTLMSKNLVICQNTELKRPHHVSVAHMPLHTTCSKSLEKVWTKKVVPVSRSESNINAQDKNKHMRSIWCEKHQKHVFEKFEPLKTSVDTFQTAIRHKIRCCDSLEQKLFQTNYLVCCCDPAKTAKTAAFSVQSGSSRNQCSATRACPGAQRLGHGRHYGFAVPEAPVQTVSQLKRNRSGQFWGNPPLLQRTPIW